MKQYQHPLHKGSATLAHPVYLIDDDDAVRTALTLLLETVGLKVTGFPDPVAFLEQIDTLLPGNLIVDIRMPGFSGLLLQQRLDEAGCQWPVIVISGHGDIDACRRAFRQGAVDYLSKPIDEQDLIDAVQKGEKLLTASAVRQAEWEETTTLLAHLTIREREIIDLVCRGLTSREIGKMLNLSARTVETHRANAGAKLGTTSIAEITQLVAIADKAT
jgi:FixJ family two-component response regulator